MQGSGSGHPSSASPNGKTAENRHPPRKGLRGRQAALPKPSRLPGNSAKAVVLGDQSKAFER
eukprot:4932013-Heterocapsa_arctica.AAC.1